MSVAQVTRRSMCKTAGVFQAGWSRLPLIRPMSPPFIRFAGEIYVSRFLCRGREAGDIPINWPVQPAS